MLHFLMRPEGLEPPTLSFEAKRSYPLRYGRITPERVLYKLYKASKKCRRNSNTYIPLLYCAEVSGILLVKPLFNVQK